MTAEEWADNWDLLNDEDKRSLAKDFREAMAEARAEALKDVCVELAGILISHVKCNEGCCTKCQIWSDASDIARNFGKVKP